MKKLSFLCFTLLAAALSHSASPANPPSNAPILEACKLVGELSNDVATFTLTANARVDNPKGGSLELLGGTVALREVGPHPKWKVRAEPNRLVVVFERAGKFPIDLKFAAAVRSSPEGGWSAVDFHVAPCPLQPIVLKGLAADTQFEFAGAARPERAGPDFLSYLPADGTVKLSWKQARPEAEGKLFYAAEMLAQISVSPGLMRQTALLDFKVMQGELKRLALGLHGAGEITRVQGEQVLAWNVEPLPNSTDRQLVVQFNQPQTDHFAIQVQAQTPLGAFPQSADALQLRPQGATRFAGCLRIVNDGAVRLEVSQAAGLSQISPEQFPETDATRAALRGGGTQRFAYRFSGGDFALRIQADQILPELSVSQVLAYRLGENEQAIEAEIELDIREAPLRELVLRVPKGYAVAQLSAPSLSDYFLRELPDQPDAELRLVYGQPLAGRQVLQLRLERNKPMSEKTWALPRLEVAQAKSVRGHLAVAADAGFRLTPERTDGLTEIATAFFPRKVPGIQSAYRISDTAWQAAVRVERLAQTVQADALHLFSIGEGIAYGSSVMNLVISGAPVSAFKVELSDEYYNVEFTGKDIRNWQKIDGGYLVQLHTPVSGAYTLLATYERPFKGQGETLAFTGARPLDAQSEQGYTLIISAYQFQVKAVDVSSGLLVLEPGEVPPEYRLFFDAPVLAAYRYTARPFSLKLQLDPLAQGDSLPQVVDRAALTTRISKEGQVLTQARYFVKNRGSPNFRLTLPPATQLWSATVNGAPVVPVMDGDTNLIPLPQRADPDALLTLELQLASRSKDAKVVSVSAPKVSAPVTLAQWSLEPDTGQRLVYRAGSLIPIGGPADVSGFAAVSRAFGGPEAERAKTLLLGALFLIAIAVVAWRWAAGGGVFRLSWRHTLGTVVGVLAFVLALGAFLQLGQVLDQSKPEFPRTLSFLAPVQQAGSAWNVEVSNVAEGTSALRVAAEAWPALLALVVWICAWWAESRSVKTAGEFGGWLLLTWAALRLPGGAVPALVILVAFVSWRVAFSALRQLGRVPPEPEREPATGGKRGPSAATALLLGGCLWLALGNRVFAAPSPDGIDRDRPVPGTVAAPHQRIRAAEPSAANCAVTEPCVAESVSQDLRIEEKFALATAKIRWAASRGDRLPLLFSPAVLTSLRYPTNAVKLESVSSGDHREQELVTAKSGIFEIEMHYETAVGKREAESGLTLPVPFGLVNTLKLTVVNLDVEVLSQQAVSIRQDSQGSNTVATLVLAPANDVWVGWKPRTRDVKREKAVYYAEISQLYVPMAGAIEGAHYVALRPAQGEINELIFDTPAGAAITDVIDAGRQAENKNTGGPSSSVSLWRFDPDARKLRVTLNPPQSRPFTLLIRSQVATGPLPFEQPVGLLTVENAAAQIGLVGLATGNEVQLDSVNADAFSPINLEDFPSEVATRLQAQLSGLTVRRAFRYSGVAPAGQGSASAPLSFTLKASAVEPDVRVETQDTLSLGEDRTILAVNATVDITRAGIFRLSFLMPAGFDVDTISGAALSHWTESKTDAGRIITMHLTGKTEGQQQFAISLAGPGVKTAKGWTVPQLVLREASKQRGTLLLAPEQGMRLQVATRDGLTQLDPQKSGIRQQGVLAFRILQTPWSLGLDIEQVDPWVEVTSLEHATVTEAQVKVLANLQYQIENTGLKSLRVFLPTNAESVRFQGEQVGDFLPRPGALTNGLQAWEIKLHRKVIGAYRLQASYQTPVPEEAVEVVVRGVQAGDVNLQRGFVTVQSGGRLQARAEAVPATLQVAEWQSIPRALAQDLPAAAANFAYRLVDPAFALPLKLERHEAAKLLPARINHLAFRSVISDDGIMLTQVRLEMQPGDKRLLELTLPKDAHFWFAFVNDNGVWPWREQDSILIPLEQQSRRDKPLPVELVYSCRLGAVRNHELDLELLAPKFDLPLEDLTWRVSLSDQWQLKRWGGSFQLQDQALAPRAAVEDLQTYLQKETSLQQERTKEAEDLLAVGNSALAQGDPQEARRAFQAAYGLSTHDAAFNEDARVQLHNMKLQQALVGLNVRQSAAAGDTGGLGGKWRDLRGRKEVSYTQQDAKDIIDRNNADENAAFMRLAERLIQQQDAAVSSASAIHANIPEQGRVLTFKRAVVVDPRADLRIRLDAVAARPGGTRVLVLGAIFLLLVLFAWAARPFRALRS
ncbi:conserved membrane hypothetical protein [Verrucomicrobia bacterium]|nr:conserved membrane hypothetical protein [Verrucomicrobiota bacterium]